MFWNPPIQKLAAITKRNITKSNFWKEFLLHYEIPAVIIKIRQSYKNEDTFQGGNLNNTYPSISYDDVYEDDHRGEQYSDHFVYQNTARLGVGTSLRNLFYATNAVFNKYSILVVSRSPHMIGLTRGVSWEANKYVRWPIIATSINTSCHFIDPNIFSGKKEKTILHCELPVGIKTQFPFAKYPVTLKTPLTNQMSRYNNITLSFKTSRHKRVHLKLKQNKKYLGTRQLRFKAYKYPFN